MDRHFWFEETISGEEFIVGAESLTVALGIAEGIGADIGNQYNDDEYEIEFWGELTDEEAEASGLDEY